jgi:dihydroflavonol-4-reductase
MERRAVLVTGATGFVGGAVAERLAQAGHEVHCLARPGGASRLRQRFPWARVHLGDLGDPTSLRGALEGRDWLLHCAGLNSFWERVPYGRGTGPRRRGSSPYRRINVEGTRNVMNAALAAGVRKVVHVSTVMAYGFPREMPFRETSPPGPHMSGYARSKHDGDALAWDLQARGGLPLVVVYLAAVVGPGDPKAVMQIRRVVEGRLPMLIRSDSRFTFVHIRDAAEAIVRAAERERNEGEAYLVGGERFSTAEYLSLISELAGVSLPKLALGRFPILPLARLLTFWAALTGRPPLLPLDLMRTEFRGSLLFDDGKTRRELGITYTPVREALREAIDEIRSR